MTYDKSKELPIGTKVRVTGDMLAGSHEDGFSYIGREGVVTGVGGVYHAEYTLDLPDVEEKWSDYFFFRGELEAIND